MAKSVYKFRSEVWLYPGLAGWHFISVPKKASEEIRAKFGARAKAWGSLPVTATIGKTMWRTSIFSDKKSGVYLLPLKGAVRKKEGVRKGDKVALILTIR